ncbi:MAG: DUF1338 domain-containing protein [Prolixibacteraceae bacterium]|nr:DUF1338 domain-containing protein [Prolixibacteraceae bacterium]MBN2773817.1 DUF1338 domain-containing protein [Prolixibacteraceae bacterium]
MKKNVREITTDLLDELWQQYLRRVSYAREYSRLILEKGGNIVNDHIAFRSLNTHTGEQPEGIRAFKHILDCLEYEPVSKYRFHQKKLNAVHFEHPDPMFPKIFVSQLEVSELPEWSKTMIDDTVIDTPYIISDNAIELLNILKEKKELPVEAADILVYELAGYFRRPWGIPRKETVLKLNDVSQYAAWVLLHGNAVNHFTAFINYQNVPDWPDLDSTCKALAEAGIPMKDSIEGEKGSILQQSATQAVKEQVVVLDENGEPDEIEWTYAYYELAERGFVKENGKKKLFSGFLGEQATHLFDMTQTRDN